MNPLPMLAFASQAPGTPRYSDEAIDRRIQGAALFQGIVGTNGKMIHMDGIRSLGYGLNEAAIECIRKTPVSEPGR